MADRLYGLDTAQAPGNQFKAPVKAEIVFLIGQNAPSGGGGGGSGNATSLNSVATSVTGSQLDSIKAKVDGIEAGATKGLVLSPTAIKTVSYTAAKGEMVRVDSAIAPLTITAPVNPADGDSFGVWLTNAVSDVSLNVSGSADLLDANSGITSFTLKSANSQVGLSIWRYVALTDYWYPYHFNSQPSVSDVLGTSVVGRALMSANSQQAARDAIGALSSDALGMIFSANYTPPVFDTSSAVVNQSWTNATSGTHTGLTFDPAVGADVFVAVHGYRAQGEEITLTPTYGGTVLEACTPMLMGNNGALNATNSSFIQFFRMPGVGVDGSAKTVTVPWSSTGTTTMQMGLFVFSYTGAEGVGSVFVNVGTETGTTMQQIVSSAPGRVVVQSFGHETLSTTAVAGYNQTSRGVMTTSANAAAIVGTAAGATSITFSATRTSGADYFTMAFEILGSVASDLSVVSLADAAPATMTSPGEYGQFFANTTHAYFCIAANSWRRWAISTW